MSHVRFRLLGHGFDTEGINDSIQGTFNLQATKDAAQAVLGSDGQVKSQHQAEAEKVLLNQDRTQLWVDLKLDMTKKQLEDHKRKCIAQAKSAESLEQVYNFDDMHSLNPVSGRQDDGTTYTKSMNHSLGNTVYNVVLWDDNSEMDDIVAEPYEAKEGGQGMDIDIDQVHRDTSSQLQGHSAPSQARAGKTSKESQASLTRPSESNKGSSISASGSRSGKWELRSYREPVARPSKNISSC